MFTGIIEDLGTLTAVRDLGGGRRLTIAGRMAPELRVDQSVAVNGVCQTVVTVESSTFDVVAIEETLKKTTLGDFAPGTRLNLERAMLPTTRLDGHMVQGHVDATGTVESIEKLATSTLVRVRFDERFAPYVIPVGSITLDGISLTVARLADHTLTVAIIPHTLSLTNAGTWRPGDSVNLEFDMIGKYVVRWLSVRRDTEHDASRLSAAWLKEQGY